MQSQNIQILTQELQNTPKHIVDEVLNYLRYLKEKDSLIDPKLKKSINRGLEQSKNGEGRLHSEVMNDLRKKLL